ncbi:hypothetical protein NDU88_003781 [Pleurodeles waltl]|uniref:Uncharacterized protein n=1 Tax=Pleurodeles waltl TaxID=8319 RepID=A0AAV7RIE6_PLEWA|nr:hypothetical protein NDU88_003781 [Pleurodeles waltl]
MYVYFQFLLAGVPVLLQGIYSLTKLTEELFQILNICCDVSLQRSEIVPQSVKQVFKEGPSNWSIFHFCTAAAVKVERASRLSSVSLATDTLRRLTLLPLASPRRRRR